MTEKQRKTTGAVETMHVIEVRPCVQRRQSVQGRHFEPLQPYNATGHLFSCKARTKRTCDSVVSGLRPVAEVADGPSLRSQMSRRLVAICPELAF